MATTGEKNNKEVQKLKKNCRFPKYKIIPPPPPLVPLSKKQKINDNDDNEIVFVEQLPVHPRERLVKATKDDVVFVKQGPLI